jgi:signal transduction histidine kinase/CheY-like chemotaxis protein
MGNVLRALIVEDLEDDAILVARELQRGNYDLIFERVDTPQAMQAALAGQAWDVVIADYSMPYFSGLAALELLQESGLDLPFIIVSGAIGEDVAVEAMKAGAHDYLMKDNLTRLVPAVQRELEEAKVRRARQQAEADLRRRADELAAITRVSREILSVPLDLHQVLASIVRHAAELSRSDASGVFIPRSGDGRLRIAAGYGVGDEFLRALEARGIPSACSIGRAAAERRTIQVPDVRAESDCFLERLDEMEGIRATLSVPMLQGERVGGVIVLWHREPRHFSSQEVAFIQALAQQCINAVENARLLRAESRRRREAETLYAVTQVLSANLDQQRVFHLILTELQKVVPYDCASVQQLRGDCLEIIDGHGFADLQALLGTTFDLLNDDNPHREVMRTREPLIVDDAPALYGDFCRFSRASWLGVPLLYGDRPIGMLALHKQEPGFYTQEHARLALAFAAQAAIVIENARLFQEEQRRRREAETLRELALALGSTLDVNQVLEQLLERVSEVIPCDVANVALVEEGVPRVAHQREGGTVEKVDVSPVMDRAPAWRHMLTTRSPCVVSDTRTVPDWTRQEGAPKVRSWLGAPIVMRDNVIGFFSLNSETANSYTPEHAELLSAFASHAALAIETARQFALEEQHIAALSRSLEKQHRLDQLKDEFIQNVSHELRTPLGLIRGYAEMLDGGDLGVLQTDQQEPIAVIARRARMLNDMVDNLMTILEAETQEPKRKPVDLADLVRKQLSDFRATLDQAGLTLTAQIAPDLPLVVGDATHLRRVLDNLLGNARKFTPAGGRIGVSLRQEGENLVLEVSDTGIGIPSDQLGRVFERFVQVDGTMSRRYGGTGLGLALVKEIVEVHGGEASVQSVLGEGSTFRVTLPCAQQFQSE